MGRLICKIADLKVIIPTAGGMAPRCKEYLTESEADPDIIINEAKYIRQIEGASEEVSIYQNSGAQFYRSILKHNGMMLHASAVEVDGRAYLFSGPCGTGKSTHTQLWRQVFGEKAIVFNDDKPAIRILDDVWYAYGTPWCGKDGINQNRKTPLAGICFLKQAQHNSICRVSPRRALSLILGQTHHRFAKTEKLDLLLNIVERLIQDIPIFELENRPEPEAARLSYETMLRAAREAGL